MKIESIRLKNYKVFRDVYLKDIPSFLVVVGANGSGKSSLFDVFGFLHDCLKGTVRPSIVQTRAFREVLSLTSDQIVMYGEGIQLIRSGLGRSEFKTVHRHVNSAISPAEDRRVQCRLSARASTL